ncbi:uncharacterized protein PV09_00226 [Verruconis gallopava]|uniref:Uncharacterized protein n=1 Tax=Verruconis gallopava TaxID=253628 RepID=A0A0D1Y2N4_9PEZI|nr:uncharacterized protein PV09_00226 [Verruconis gallopava]KIW09311.1 hypothetical protein PV09_00226 [Verruconis gallopava]
MSREDEDSIFHQPVTRSYAYFTPNMFSSTEKPRAVGSNGEISTPSWFRYANIDGPNQNYAPMPPGYQWEVEYYRREDGNLITQPVLSRLPAIEFISAKEFVLNNYVAINISEDQLTDEGIEDISSDEEMYSKGTLHNGVIEEDYESRFWTRQSLSETPHALIGERITRDEDWVALRSQDVNPIWSTSEAFERVSMTNSELEALITLECNGTKRADSRYASVFSMDGDPEKDTVEKNHSDRYVSIVHKSDSIKQNSCLEDVDKQIL